MPITIYKKVNNTEREYALVPAPMVSISRTTYNNIGRPGFGNEYQISLQGHLIPNMGSIIYDNNGTSDIYHKPTSEQPTGIWHTMNVEDGERTQQEGHQYLDSIITKQEALRWLFSNEVNASGFSQPIKMQIRGWTGQQSPYGTFNANPKSGIYCLAYVDDLSIDSDGGWINPVSYNVTLRTNGFLNPANITNNYPSGTNELFPIANPTGWMVTSVSQNVDIQEDGRSTITYKDRVNGGYSDNKVKEVSHLNKVYSVNRSITAIGAPRYNEDGKYVDNRAPWQQASGYINEYMNVGSLYGFSGQSPRHSGIHSYLQKPNNSGDYRAANVVIQESIDPEAGSYTLNESYILYSGKYPVLETISISTDVEENGTKKINVQGTVQGLNTLDPFASSGNAALNALFYTTGVLQSGVSQGYRLPDAYYFARSAVSATGGFLWLHPKPLSESMSTDYSAGTVSYTYSYDTRPPNIIPGSISESIQINDTYPGEIFSVTPVIGRNQPVLQYLNSRSEYKRSLSINVTMSTQTNHTATTNNNLINNGNYYNHLVIGGDVDLNGKLNANVFNNIQYGLIWRKPSITNTAAFNAIFQAANPVNDPETHWQVPYGKCYHSAPTENWDPRTGNYSYSIEWTYERYYY
jgi:hypothetical protein